MTVMDEWRSWDGGCGFPLFAGMMVGGGYGGDGRMAVVGWGLWGSRFGGNDGRRV